MQNTSIPRLPFLENMLAGYCRPITWERGTQTNKPFMATNTNESVPGMCLIPLAKNSLQMIIL